MKLLRDIAERCMNDMHLTASIVLTTALTLAVGVMANPTEENVAARILIPQTEKELDTAKKVYENQDALNNAVAQCKEKKADGEKVIEAFERAFGGILPGGGRMLQESPSTVEAKKSALLFEAITAYAERKYCIPKEAFLKTYGAEYESVIDDHIAVYLEAEEGDAQIWKIPAAIHVVSKDLEQTFFYLKNIVERAMLDAYALDDFTEMRLTNAQIQIGNIQQFKNIEYLDGVDKKLDKIEELKMYQLAYVDDINIYRGSEKSEHDKKLGEEVDTEKLTEEIPAVNEEETITSEDAQIVSSVTTKMKSLENNLSFGLLNITKRSGWNLQFLALYAMALEEGMHFSSGSLSTILQQVGNGGVSFSKAKAAHMFCKGEGSAFNCTFE